MEDKYLPGLDERKETLFTQIEECKRIIYRNLLENVLFVANGEKAKQKEVVYNNEQLTDKIDALVKEWDKLSEEKLSDYENRRHLALSRAPV